MVQDLGSAIVSLVKSCDQVLSKVLSSRYLQSYLYNTY